MLKNKKVLFLVIVLCVTMLLSACNLPGQAAATPDPLDVQATVDAAVTQAVVALTGTAAALPTSTFTVTPTLEPTATSTPEPTATEVIPTATNTKVPIVYTSTPTATPLAYSCSVISSSPTAGKNITVGTDFDAVWKVKNSGTKAWEVGYVDLSYVSGTKMQTVADVFDVSSAVKKNGEITLTVDMKAPATAGKYTAAWALKMEGTTMCVLQVSINAVN